MLSSALLAAEASAAPLPCADLQITGVTIKPTAPAQTTLISGQPANIEIAVKNAGSCAAGGFVVRFMTAPNSLTVVSGSIGSLGAGASTTITLAYSFPKAGNFDTEVQLNPKREVPETNYANDIALKAITVVQASVKFVITHFSVASVDPTDAVVEGRPALATITVENTGNVAAGAFVVQWTPFILATSVTHDVAAGLAPGKTETVQISFTYTFHGTATGTAAVLMSGGSIPLASTTLETVIEQPLANLRIVRVLAPSDNFATRPSTQQVEIENDGNAAAGHFIAQWSPGTGQTVQQQQVNGLGEGAKTILTFTYVFPKPGTYEGLITLDATKLIKELFTTEKTAKTVLVIPEGLVDLTVTGLSVEAVAPGPVVQETPTVVFVKVKNQGNIESPSFVTEWNPNSLGISGTGLQSVTEETGPLAPGGERTITFVMTYPKPGNFRGVAEVNPQRTVKESNYANNSEFTEVFVEQLPIDLNFSTGIEVSSPEFNANGVLFPGEPATVSFEVKNSGPIATGAFAVQFQSAASAVKQTRTIPGLNPGESQLETFNVTYSKPGTYTMTAILDPNKQVDKVVNGFNPIEETRVVTVEPIDLNFTTGIEVSSPEFNAKEVLFPGEEATAKITVQDKSPVPTGAFAVQFQSEEGGFKQTQFVEKLNAGEPKTLTFKVKYYKPGSYTMTAILDPFKQIDKKVNGLSPIDSLPRVVTVDEKEASVYVTAPTLEVTHSFNWVWLVNLLVYDKGAKCYEYRYSAKGEVIEKLVHNEAPQYGSAEQCAYDPIESVHTGVFGSLGGLSSETTLKEEEPLRASVHAETYPEEYEYVLFGSSAGSATVEKSRKEYVELPSHPYKEHWVDGEGCKQPGGDEYPTDCFNSLYTLLLESNAGPAFAPVIHARSPEVRSISAAHRLSRELAAKAAGTSQNEEPEGTVSEKQADAERELEANEAAERKAAETAASAAEAAERTAAIAAEQEAIKATQELQSEVAQLNREQSGAGAAVRTAGRTK
jgi:hypothetical protein